MAEIFLRLFSLSDFIFTICNLQPTAHNKLNKLNEPNKLISYEL